MIRVVLADDHHLVRKGIRALLDRVDDIDVVGEAGDGCEAIQQVQRLNPDVLVMDIAMPRLNGTQATERIRSMDVATQVVILSMYSDETLVRQALRCGARGYLLKRSVTEELLLAVRAAARGAGALLTPRDLLARTSVRASAEAGARGTEGMGYRMLGKTGIRVSEVGFGSHLTGENRADPPTRMAQIRKGLDLGVNLFDIYDHTYHQFELMSEALGPVRQDVLLSLVTVWSVNQTLQEVEYALETFNTDYIDLYRIYMDEGTPRGDVEKRFDALQQAKQEGKIRAVGLVTHDHAVVSEMLRTYPELDYVMLPYNFQFQRFSPVTMVRPERWGQIKLRGGDVLSRKAVVQVRDCLRGACPDPELLPLIRKTGAGVLVIKPFAAGGLLSLTPSDPLLEQLKEAEVSLPRAALRFVLENPDICSVLPAMNSIDEVVEDAGASGGDGMSEAEAMTLEIYAAAAEKARGAYLPPGYAWLEQWRVCRDG